MRFLGFDFVVQPATLTMRFVYDDPKWTPLEASATPVAVFQFTDVLVWQWEDDHALMFETPQEGRSQISDFGYYAPTNVFSLETLSTRLLFSAGRLVVRLEPLPNGQQPAGQDRPKKTLHQFVGSRRAQMRVTASRASAVMVVAVRS